MSPALSQLSGKQVVAALERAGFEHVSTKGSHAKLRHPDGRRTIVPLHRTVARGTLDPFAVWVDPAGVPGAVALIGHICRAAE